jgi:hypothetical protein
MAGQVEGGEDDHRRGRRDPVRAGRDSVRSPAPGQRTRAWAAMGRCSGAGPGRWSWASTGRRAWTGRSTRSP